MFVGHDHLVKDFKSLAKSSQLAHGYIFFGEPEVGKFYFAKHLANFLENGEFELSERPLQDALILEDASGIEEMQQIKNFLWQKPAVSNKRLAAIGNAENLTPQAQNAILKITEEPPEHSLIILAVNQLENLLPALQSRMQKIYFGRLSDNEMAKIGSNKKIIEFSFGRPGRAKRLGSDILTKQAEKYAEDFLKISNQNRSNLIKALIEEQKENSALLDLFFESLILKLSREPVRNYQLLRLALHRLFLIKSYNTNKRLQIEAISNY